MQKKRKLLPRLTALVTVLLLLNLFTFVLTANAILQVCDTTPTAEVSLTEADLTASGGAGVLLETAPVQSSQEMVPAVTEQAETVQAAQDNIKPGSSVYDEDKTWGKETEIEIFSAWYDNATGEVTVRSAGSDKLIAPGTGDQYYFHIKNTGNVSLTYSMRAEAKVHFTKNDQNLTLPLEVRFSDHTGKFHVGSSTAWEDVRELDGVTDKGVLSANHYAKYTLEWQWPFEGDDTLDTLLGNMAADGDEISVTIAFYVNAEASTGTGGLPQTGDTSNVAMWAGVCVCSGFGLVILLFGRRKEEENAAA